METNKIERDPSLHANASKAPLVDQAASLGSTDASNRSLSNHYTTLAALRQDGSGGRMSSMRHISVGGIWTIRDSFMVRLKSMRNSKGEDTAPLFVGKGMLHPYSMPRLSWDMFMAVLLTYTAFMVPYTLAFEATWCVEGVGVDIGALAVIWIVDICFWIDIVMNFWTAIPGNAVDSTKTSEVKMITDARYVARKYLSTWFMFDALGAIPVHAIESLLQTSQNGCNLAALTTLKLNRLARLTQLLKLLRLIKMTRFNALITKCKDVLQINPGYLHLASFIVGIFFLAHFLACILFWLQDHEDFVVKWAYDKTVVIPGEGLAVVFCPEPIYDDSGNISASSRTRFTSVTVQGSSERRLVTECLVVDGSLSTSEAANGTDGSEKYSWKREADSSVQYLISLYSIMQTITTVGFGDMSYVTSPEVVYGIFVIVIGASGFGVVVGSISSLLGRLDLRVADFTEKMNDLEDFMFKENLPIEMRHRVRDYCSYAFHNSREIPSAVEHLSMSLRCDVALYLYKDLVSSVPFFAKMSKEFLTDIIMKLKAVTLAPKDSLYEKGEFGDSMYFLIKGVVELEMDIDGEETQTIELAKGCYLGESCLMGSSDYRPLTVRASTWCNFFCLTQSCFVETIYQHTAECSELFDQGDVLQGSPSNRTDKGAVQMLDYGLTMEGTELQASPKGEQPPIVRQTLERITRSEKKDLTEELERKIDQQNLVELGAEEVEDFISDGVWDKEFDAGQFGKRRRRKRHSLTVLKDEDLLESPASMRADYDLLRVKLNNDLVRLKLQQQSVFKA